MKKIIMPLLGCLLGVLILGTMGCPAGERRGSDAWDMPEKKR